MSFGIDDTRRFIDIFLEKVKREKDRLSDLDSQVGDGDHGTNMEHGLTAAVSRISGRTYQDLGTMIGEIAINFMDAAGGYSGPLIGVFLMKISEIAAGKTEMPLDKYAGAMRDGLISMKKLGHAEIGSKTMVDALEPAIDALLSLSREDELTAFKAAAEAANAGMESTRDMPHSLGRAVHPISKAIGTIDAGAMTMKLMFDSYVELFQEKSA